MSNIEVKNSCLFFFFENMDIHTKIFFSWHGKIFLRGSNGHIAEMATILNLMKITDGILAILLLGV